MIIPRMFLNLRDNSSYGIVSMLPPTRMPTRGSTIIPLVQPEPETLSRQSSINTILGLEDFAPGIQSSLVPVSRVVDNYFQLHHWLTDERNIRALRALGTIGVE